MPRPLGRAGRRLAAAGLVLAVTLAAGCAARGPVLPEVVQRTGAATSIELAETPFFPQTEHYCGPAALAMVLNTAGVDVGMQELGSRVYLPEKRGSLQIEVAAAARHYRRMPYRIDGSLGELLTELRAGRPVLVFQNLGVKLIPVWHYAVVVGYDAGADTIVLRSGRDRRRVMAAGDFLDTWERADRWGIVVLRPGEMPADPDPGRYLSAVAAMEELVSTELAMQWLRAARERWPANAMVRFALGNSLYAAGDSRAAIAAFREALARDPGLVAARNNLAHLLAERGCLDAAMREIDRALADAGARDQALRQTVKKTRTEIRERLDSGADAGACEGA